MDHNAEREIDKIASRILKEAGLLTPPVKVEQILSHLNLHCDYYDLSDPNLIDEIKHALNVQVSKLKGILRKINFLAATVPGEGRIFIDKSIQGSSRQKWTTLHEASHNFLPWHKAFAHADTAETLSPEFQMQLEQEANYGVQRLLFLGDLFKEHALDSKPSLKAISELKETYESSWESTLRHYVLNTHEVPMMLMVCPLFWDTTHPNYKRGFRYFLRTTACEKRFPGLRTEAVLRQFDRTAITASNIDSFEPVYIAGPDIAGDRHLFRIELMTNRYDIFVLVLPEKRIPLSVSLSTKAS